MKKRKKLNLDERIKIEIGYCVNNQSMREIARLLDRDVSSISREINSKTRHGVNKYQAYVAHNRSIKRKETKTKKELLKCEYIRNYVTLHLKLGWTPEQISGRLKKDSKSKYVISHEAIYQYVYSTYREEDLRVYLVLRRKRRMKKNYRSIRRLERKDKYLSIDERPKEVDRRKVTGHFEDDCVVSKITKDRLKTINERVTGVVFIEKMIDGTSKESNDAVIRALSVLPSNHLKTLTRDNGVENLDYQTIESKLNMKVYYAHPYHSWERGINENSNGLIRRYFPKGTDFSKVTYEEIKKVEFLLNTKPRKRLAYMTTYEVYYKLTNVAIGG
jgi:IS30 family transposase